MTRHKHADLMIAYAEDSSLEIECFSSDEGVWKDVDPPKWFPNVEYRIKPKPHKWQDLIDIQNENPNTVFEIRFPDGERSEWSEVAWPTFSLSHAEYRVKPKSITLHQYVYKMKNEFFLSSALYKNIQEAKVAAGNSFEVIGPAPWTAYTIEE